MKRKVLMYPVATEKMIKLVETENKIAFVVGKDAKKEEVRKAFEEDFKVKVLKVNIVVRKGRKIAFIKLPVENPAIDIATKLGVLG